MKNEFFKRIIKFLFKPIIIIVLLVIFHGVNNYIVLKQNTTLPTADSATNYYLSLARYHGLIHLDFKEFLQADYGRGSEPPLLTISSIPFYVFFGKSTFVAAMTNMIYLVILIFSVYGIGKKLYSQQVGLFAAFITSTFPTLFGFSRMYLSEFALVSIVSLSIYFMLKTDHFEDRRYSLLFGISIGLGLLTRISYLVFVSLPFIFYLYISFKLEPKRVLKKKIKNILISALTGLIISSFWYGLFLKENLRHILYNLIPLKVVSPEVVSGFSPPFYSVGSLLSLSNLIYYVKILGHYQIGLFYFLLFLICLLIYTSNLIPKKEYPDNFPVIPSWILVPFVIFTFLTVKDPRFIIPYLPAIALLTSFIVFKVPKLRFKNIILCFVFLIGLIQFFSVTYFPQYQPFWGLYQKEDVLPFQSMFVGLQFPYKEDWQTRNMLNTIFRQERDSPEGLKILIIPFDHNFIDHDMLKSYHIYILNNPNPIQINTPPLLIVGGADSPNDLKYNIESINQEVIDSELIIISDKEFQFPEFAQKVYIQFKESFERNISLFSLIKKFDLPDGTSVYLYQKKI